MFKKKKEDTISYEAVAALAGTTVEDFKKEMQRENERIDELRKQWKKEMDDMVSDRNFRIRQHKAKVKKANKLRKSRIKGHKKKFKK